MKIIKNLIFNTNRFKEDNFKRFSKGIKNKKILEIGTGKHSLEKYFDSSNKFIKSDIIDYGYKIVDVTKMNFKEEFDIIICKAVLEHVFEIHKAIENMYNALKKNGKLLIVVPFAYPLHDEPNDYWRFTEHCLRRLLNKFNKIEVKQTKLRRFPFIYFVEAIK